jgi:hypothetical protein
MSQNNSKKKVGHITLFFNRHLNIFPDDFFITKNKNLVIKKNPFNEENAKNEQNNEDNITNNINNNTTTNFRKSIKNISNKIKFDNINKKDISRFSFKERDARSKFIKSKSLSDLDDEKYNEQNQFLRNPVQSKRNLNSSRKYYLNIYNNKFKNVNIQSNELFTESKLKYKNNNYDIINNKYKNKSKINIRNYKNIKTETSKENTSQYSKPKNPIILPGRLKAKIPKKAQKILKIANSSEINLKYPKIKRHLRDSQYLITEAENKMKMNNDINKLNKRPSSSNKQNIKTKIKNTIDNIFVELSKNYEDNQDILDKFNSLIRDVKNIQKVIKHKKVSIYKNNNKL